MNKNKEAIEVNETLNKIMALSALVVNENAIQAILISDDFSYETRLNFSLFLIKEVAKYYNYEPNKEELKMIITYIQNITHDLKKLLEQIDTTLKEMGDSTD